MIDMNLAPMFADIAPYLFEDERHEVALRLAREMVGGDIGKHTVEDEPPGLAAGAVEKWNRIELAPYLEARGWSGRDLADIIVPFRSHVVKAFITEHKEPPRRSLSDGDYFFVPSDKTLIDRVYKTEITDCVREVRDGKKVAA